MKRNLYKERIKESESFIYLNDLYLLEVDKMLNQKQRKIIEKKVEELEYSKERKEEYLEEINVELAILKNTLAGV